MTEKGGVIGNAIATAGRRPAATILNPRCRWMRTGLRVLALATGLVAGLGFARGEEGVESGAELDPAMAHASPQARPGREAGGRRVFRDRVEPHWFDENRRFWYRNELADGASEFIVVDAVSGTRGPAFDAGRLAAGLTAASGKETKADRLPFDRIRIEAGQVQFPFEGGVWGCDLGTYRCGKVEGAREIDSGVPEEGGRRRGGRRPGEGAERSGMTARSPDGQWEVVLKGHNVHLRPAGGGGEELALSTDGQEGNAYVLHSWSPDSRTLAAFRMEPGERREVHLVESSPKEGGRARLRSRPYPLPGDRFSKYELNLFDVATRRQLKPGVDRFEHEWLRPRIHWTRDGARLGYQQVDRGHQRFRVISVGLDGGVRNLVDERSDTFIWTAHTENLALNLVNWLTNSEEVLYVSERSGWRHVYLVDAVNGGIRNPVTQGDWVLRGIDRIDEERREVWFQASGVFPGQDPYFLHSGRVRFDGTGLVWLTAGDGNHAVQFSPDRRHLIDTHSRVDRAPVTELRRCSDGGLVCVLETADTRLLESGGWKPPQVFTAKGRDGTTDIWGIICRPPDFDPQRRYPVIEDIYAGPQGSFAPKTFSAAQRYESLTRLGFIVVKLDGMGTANRSKAFHDACWKNLKDGGFPDRIAWMRAAAARHPELDLTRVGVFGTSAGGQNAAGAVLFHPEFYKVAVANCGCHDNRMDKASWNEQWMGYPVGPQYAESSNIDNAARLQGKLMLVVGELDDNVPPESTYRFVDALIRAGKDFDFLLVPGGGHGAGGAYGQRRLQDFFVRHLLGQEPPDRNVTGTKER